MSRLLHFLSRGWLWALLGAVVILCCVDAAWVRRVRYISGIGEEPGLARLDSPTGYVDGTRSLVVPEHLAASFRWIEQTQSMLAGGPLRARVVENENAPFGRPSYAASPYRWWLGFVAWLDHVLYGHPLGLAAEEAALFADPLLHLLWLVAGTLFFARFFGSFAAGLFAIGSVVMFPFAATFMPGVPDDFGFALIMIASSVAALLPALKDPSGGIVRAPRRWFVAAGVAGGVGMWLNPAIAVPVLFGAGLGGLVAAWIARTSADEEAIAILDGGAWRAWAVGGASTVLAACLIEYFPGALGTTELRTNHPLYGVAWLGVGELLARAVEWIGRRQAPRRLREVAASLAALSAVASVPVAMWRTGSNGILAVDLLSFRLTRQPDGIVEPNVATWLTHEGLTNAAWATLLPVVLAVAAICLIFSRKVAPRRRAIIALASGPVVTALVLSYLHLRWWAVWDALALVLVAVACAAVRDLAPRAWPRWAWVGMASAIFAIGAMRLFPAKDGTGNYVVTVPEAEELIERDLGRWLAKRADPDRRAIVLAPPALTDALSYFGGLRGVASLAWENKDGLTAALRIMVSNSPEESHELVRQRGINYIVVPSWDPFFETYTRAGSVQSGDLFLPSLQQWRQPSWLLPLAYQMPRIGGFEQQSVLVFQVMDNQSEVLSLCRLAEYFLEVGQAENAKAVARALRRFPMNLGAAVARAQVDIALGDSKEFASAIEALARRLSTGADRGLAWDLRVTLADLLARGQQIELSKRELQHCLEEADASKIRSLMPLALFHLMYLTKGFGLEFKDPAMHEVAMDLLPPEMRARL